MARLSATIGNSVPRSSIFRGFRAELPERVLGLINEVRWIACGALGVYLFLILATYNRADPGWSHAVHGAVVKNSGGRFGAWRYEIGNMDHSVMQGVEAVNRLLLNEQETTWPHPDRINGRSS